MMNDTDTDLNQTIAALAARIQTLETERCECEKCRFRQREAVIARHRARGVEIAALPPDEAFAAIEALPPATAHEVLSRIPRLFNLALVAPPDVRARLVGFLSQRDQVCVRATLAYRAGELPNWLAIRGEVRVYERLIKVPSGACDELARAGIKVRGGCDMGGNQVYTYQRDAYVGGRLIYVDAEWHARLRFDDELRSAVDAGKLIAVPLDEREAVDHQVALWLRS